jgi:acetylornithine deacetylase
VERRGANLWFETRGTGPRILFLSHLDTVPPCDGWKQDPFRPAWSGESLTGLGANDAKGCVAALVLAAQEARDTDGARAVFAFVAGEEVGGKGIREILPELGRLDAAVVGEPTGLEVCTAQRGMLVLRCAARGEAAHVAHAALGENAVHKAARDILKLADLRFEPHPLLGETRAQTTTIQGGRARNQVPDACEFFVDLRLTPNLDACALAERFARELESEVAIHSLRYQAVSTDPSEPVVVAALAASPAKAPKGSATASDWAFLSHLPAVKAGPGDTHRSHRPDEWIALSEVLAGRDFYASLLRGYAREAGRG